MQSSCSVIDRTEEIKQELLIMSTEYPSAREYEITLQRPSIESLGAELISWRTFPSGNKVKVILKGSSKRWYKDEKYIGEAQDLIFEDSAPFLLPPETVDVTPRQFFNGKSIVGTRNYDTGFNFFVGEISYPPSVHVTVIENKYLLFQSPFFESFLTEEPVNVIIPPEFEVFQVRSNGVPVTILKSKNTKLPSKTLVSVYGSYGEIHREFYSPLLLAAIKKGLVRVLIHVRGGSELGFRNYDEKLEDPRVSAKDLNYALLGLYKMNLANPQTTSLIAKSAGAVPVFLANPNVAQIFLRSPLLDLVRSTSDPTIPQSEREAYEWGYKAEELSPFNQRKLSAPIYIFHQRQDKITPLEDTLRFLEIHQAELFISDGDHLKASDDVVERRWTAEILARALRLG